jgi:2-dehydro-3-deoxy-D-gluconate 5-dehydrogenase
MAEPATQTIQQLFDLTGRSAVITGAAAGIGYGIAARLAEAGAGVVIADRDGERAEAAARTLRGQGRLAQAAPVDVRSSADVERLIEVAVGAYGGLDILVNNAGIYPLRPVRQMSEAEWNLVLDVNLKGTFRCAQAAAGQMIRQGRGGVILNIAATAALRPSLVGLAHYDASKAGMLAFTRNLALELAPHRIRVLAIAPGEIDTEGTRANAAEISGLHPSLEQTTESFLARIPLGRLGEPDDIGRVALFLASDAAAYLTGAAVVVDGGFMLT